MIPKEKIPKTVEVQAIRKLEQERNGTLGEANKLQVTCSTDNDRADTLARKLTAIVRIIKDRFTELKRPATETLRQIRQLESDMLAPVEETKRGLNLKKRDWRAEEQRKIAEINAQNAARQRERDVLEEKHAAEHRAVPGPPPKIEKPAPIELVDVTNYRVSWKPVIIDVWKIPDEYLVFNEGAIRAKLQKAISAAPKGDDKEPLIEIPGVSIERTETEVYA